MAAVSCCSCESNRGDQLCECGSHQPKPSRLPTKRKVVHGVVVSPDDRYAFVSVEGIGAASGTVEVIDLGAPATVGTADVGAIAAGVDIWKVE